MRKSSMRRWSFTSISISKYLSSRRKPSMRGRSFTSLFYQQSPEFYKEVLHEGEKLHLPFLSQSTWAQWGSLPWGGGASPPFLNQQSPEFNEVSSRRGRSFTSFFVLTITWVQWGSPPWGEGASPWGPGSALEDPGTPALSCTRSLSIIIIIWRN